MPHPSRLPGNGGWGWGGSIQPGARLVSFFFGGNAQVEDSDDEGPEEEGQGRDYLGAYLPLNMGQRKKLNRQARKCPLAKATGFEGGRAAAGADFPSNQ